MNHIFTQVINLGRTPHQFDGVVNTPVIRGSTIIVNSFQEWEMYKHNGGVYRHYGRFGSATTKCFESAINELEHGAGCMVFPSGLSACTHTLMAFIEAGDHVLIADNIYGPTREFANHILPRLGISVAYFNPLDLESLKKKINARTSVVFIESPGSMTFEVCDMAAICEISHRFQAKVLVDNSWATPLFFRPLEHGADVSIQAVTKYISGHSDVLMGTATANEESIDQLRKVVHLFGEITSPDDIYLAARGLRSLAVRLNQHQANALVLAQFLEKHPLIESVNYPALDSHPNHLQWKKDFNGATGLFSFYLKSKDSVFVETFFNSLKYFHIGLSWGGYESLILPVGQPHRSDTAINNHGYLVRIHVGLEHIEELKNDLSNALDMAAKIQVNQYSAAL